jgi:uncharacterized coiled-coil protein SlyX
VRGLAHGAPVDAGQEAQDLGDRLAAQEDVLADVQVIGQRQVLVDRLDAALPALLRAVKATASPL